MSELDDRLRIWVVLSEFYLDNELQESDYDYIYSVLKNSGLTIKKLKEIDLYEVFPTLQLNLNSIAGEWAGFDEEWLRETCSRNYRRRNNFFFRSFTWLRNLFVYWMRKEQWREVEKRFEAAKIS